MTISSPQTVCWTGSTDYASSYSPCVITITAPTSGYSLSSDTITISNTCYSPTHTISTFGTGIASLTTAQLNSIGTSDTFTFHLPEDWKDQFPNWSEVQKMCEEYPGLKIAFEKFKTTYLLVKNHYDTPEDQRPRP